MAKASQRVRNTRNLRKIHMKTELDQTRKYARNAIQNAVQQNVLAYNMRQSAIEANDRAARLATLLCLVVAKAGGTITLPALQISALPDRHLLQERYDEESDTVILTSALRPEVPEEQSMVETKPTLEIVKPKIEVVRS